MHHTDGQKSWCNKFRSRVRLGQHARVLGPPQDMRAHLLRTIPAVANNKAVLWTSLSQSHKRYNPRLGKKTVGDLTTQRLLA